MPRSRLPETFAPTLCTLAHEPVEGARYVSEIKYDGFRLLARKRGKSVRLFTRGGHQWSDRLPRIAEAIASLPCRDAWIDGELVYLDDGLPSFEPLAGALRSGNDARLFYYAFDLPWLNGANLCRVPLLERKTKLEEIVRDSSRRIQYVRHVTTPGADFHRAADSMNLEGIVSKRVDSGYAEGRRTRDWLKLKCWRRQSVVIGGIERDAEGRVVALLAGTPDGARLRYEGRVEFALGRVSAVWRDAKSVEHSPFGDALSSNRYRTWFDPRATIEIQALPRGQGGGRLLRHATALRAIG